MKQKLSPIIPWLLALLLWQALASVLGQRLILPSPISAMAKLFALMAEADFWARAGYSLLHIAAGFVTALIVGFGLGILAGKFPLAERLLRPYMLTIKSVPVVSFIIVVLWILSSGLSVFISFLMVLPVIYSSVLSGVKSVDSRLIEAATVFHVPFSRRLRYLWLPAIRPYLISGCGVGLGLAWKSGIAAEVIGVSAGSMGEALYEAKIYFGMAELFAYTIAIVLLSLGFEKLFLFCIRRLFDRIEEA